MERAAAGLRWLALPVASAAAAAAVSVAFRSFWINHGVDSVVVVVVIITAVYGGFRPALLTLALAAAGTTALVPPVHVATLMEVLGILLLGIPVAAIGASLRAAWQRAERAAHAAERALARADEERRASRQSAQLVTSVVENSPNMVFVKSAADLRFVLVNRAAEELLGHTQAELVGKTDLDVFPREQAERFRADDRAVLERRTPLELPDEAIETARGERRLHTKKVPIVDEEGQPVYLLGTSEDITERKRAREERERLLAAEQAARAEAEAAARRLTALLELTEGALAHVELDQLLPYVVRNLAGVFAVDTVAIVLLTPDGRELELRAAHGLEDALRLGLRFPADRGVAGRTLASPRPLAIDDLTQVELASPLLRERGVRSVLAAPLRLDDRALGVVHVGTLALRRFDPEEAEFLQIIAIRIAVAIERARLYEAERRAAERAERAIRARDDLLATVSHDLRNPLSAISLGAAALRSYLAGEVTDDIAEKSVQIIDRTAGRMTRLIEDLLDASKLEGSTFPLEPTRTDPRVLADEALDAVHPLAVEKALTLVQLVDHGIESVQCDRQRLLQVLSNLLGNAVKFTAPGGTVTLRTESRPGEVVFSVSDTGHGIPPEQLPHLFERHWQAPGAGGQGSGLGLYIAKGIVEAHGGRIWVASTPGAGSTFSFVLPQPLRQQVAVASGVSAALTEPRNSAERTGRTEPAGAAPARGTEPVTPAGAIDAAGGTESVAQPAAATEPAVASAAAPAAASASPADPAPAPISPPPRGP